VGSSPWSDPILTPQEDPRDASCLELNCALVEKWLVEFLRDEATRRRGFERAVVGLSGGVDSAVTTYLAARAFGPTNVHAFLMPYKTSSQESHDHAMLVAERLGIHAVVYPITDAVDGLLGQDPDECSPHRRGNVCARTRMIVLFDQAYKLSAIPLGTGNKTERMFGYFTWHGDDAPPLNPLGDLFKTQVRQLARHLGVPEPIISKPPSADLIKGQTDEGDLGIEYVQADLILDKLLAGYSPEQLIGWGFDAKDVEVVRRRVNSTHWKRQLPTTAMLSSTAIGEYYLRPVDYVR